MSNDNTTHQASKTTKHPTVIDDFSDIMHGWNVGVSAHPYYTHRTIPHDWTELKTVKGLSNIQIAEYLVNVWPKMGLKTTIFYKIEGMLITYDGRAVDWVGYDSQPARHNIEIATYNYQNITLERKRKEYEALSEIYQKMRGSLKNLIFEDVLNAYEVMQAEAQSNGDYEHAGIARFQARHKQRVKNAYRARMATIENTPRNIPTMAEKAKKAGSQYFATFGPVMA